VQTFSFDGNDSGHECAVKAMRSRLHPGVEMAPVSGSVWAKKWR